MTAPTQVISLPPPQLGRPQVLASGPWNRVLDVNDPYATASPQVLADALNGYIPDPQNWSGWYQRPAFLLPNSPTNLGAGMRAAGQWHYTSALTGTEYNFVACDGHLYRVTAAGVATDVTPTNITIDATATTRVFFQQLNDELIVTDGVNTPWLGTNLGSTPITATPISAAGNQTLLEMGTTNTKIGNVAFLYAITGATFSSPNNPVGTAIPASGSLTPSKWGVFKVEINASGTITVLAGAANYSGSYATEASALAATPATSASNYSMGVVTVLSSAAGWAAGTDALAGGTGGNPATTTNYYAADMSPWVALGQPAFYQGSIMFIVATPPAGANVDGGVGFMWCEPNQPSVGYCQSGYADFWNYLQVSQRQLRGLLGIEQGLVIWHDQGIGMASGTPSSNFASTATTQLISDTIGLQASATIARYLTNIFFCDQFGRPQMIQGTTLVDPQLWLQLRAQVEANNQAGAIPQAVQNVGIGVIEPNLKLYLCGAWASGSLGTNNTPVTTLYAFDAASGNYVGRWQVSAGVAITSAVVQRDANNNAQLWLTAEETAGGGGNYLWMFQLLSANQWNDNISTPQTVNVTTGRMGYGANQVWECSQTGTAIMGSDIGCSVLVTTPYESVTFQASPTPSASQDGTFRAVVGLDIHAARGIQCALHLGMPTFAQGSFQRFEMLAIASMAGPEDA